MCHGLFAQVGFHCEWTTTKTKIYVESIPLNLNKKCMNICLNYTIYSNFQEIHRINGVCLCLGEVIKYGGSVHPTRVRIMWS